MSIEILDVSAMKPFVTATFNRVTRVRVSCGKDSQNRVCTGSFVAEKPKRAMWWRSMKPRRLAGVDEWSLGSER